MMNYINQIKKIIVPSLLMFSCYTLAANGNALDDRKCIPCSGEIPPLKGEELLAWHHQLQGGWILIGEHHIEKEYEFEDFLEALDFTNKIAVIAEENGHHPNILLCYGYVKLMLWTFKIDGLSESDFILAAKIDAAFL